MMSAGSPRRSRSQTRTTQGCVTVSPQHVTDPTILDSVAGFINEVATYNVPFDNKDQIQWARFEQLDCDAVLENLNGDKIIPSALILVLGYSTGIQVWAIPANGEAVELLSWRHGSVKVLRFLPSPYIVGRGSLPDLYALKRPLMALCDTTTPGPHHCALSFLSLKTGEQVKVIKFKNPILDVVANRRSVVVTFSERIAIFDAFTLEDRLTVTTCYLSPGIYPNPVALGARWLAYAEKKLISNKRSSGGNEGEGVQSYTATVLHAAKSLGKGLRELGETVASSLTGNPPFKPGSLPANTQPVGNSPLDALQKGVVTVLDIENQDEKNLQTEGVVAHFAAHSEAIVCLAFDPSGLLLLTADKRGHDFHLFRIHPHPGGPALAAVHHLYILHRGDTTARVQDMCFSPDSRWVTVSTLRGTSHVFPITPYGGNVGVRTHATPHVVNRMSRFHRSAGLPVEGRSNSPVSLFEAPVNSNLPYNNPRLPPYPHPTIVHPLAQIRQPLFIQATGNIQQRPHAGRPRLNSSSEDNIQVALRLSCCFAPARAWFDNATQAHDTSITKQQAKPVESLFIMSCHGTLLQYDLDPHHIASVPKEKVCDETPIELTVHAKAQWVLQRQLHLVDVPLPVSPQNLNLLPQDVSLYKSTKPSHMDDRWLSQVEIVTHAGPHRRLWMGPQFTFKTYTTTNGSPISLSEAQTLDVGRSKPVNMPVSTTYPILIESGSASSCEQSPKLMDTYQRLSEEVGGAGELQLKEDLADAMLESPGVRESGGRCVIVSMKPHTTGVAKVVNPLGTVVTIHSDDDTELEVAEDAVIHENCDEALFRPVVAPKPLLLAENRSRILNKAAVNSRTSISETVRTKPLENIKDETENGRRIKPKVNSSEKINESNTVEIGKTKFIPTSEQVELKTKTQNKNNKSELKYQSKSEIKIDITTPKTDITTPKIDITPKVIERPTKIASAPKNTEKTQKIIEKTSKVTEKNSKIELTPKIIESTQKITESAPKIIESSPKIIESTPKIVESPLKIITPTPKIIEHAPKIVDPAPKIIEQAPKIITTITSKKSKTKSKSFAFLDRDRDSDNEKSSIPKQEIIKKSVEVGSKLSLDSLRSNNKYEYNNDTSTLKTLITTPDLMDSVDTFDFPLTLNKCKNKEKSDEEEIFEFSSLSKNEDFLKEEKFEDARDTADILESHSTFKVETPRDMKSFKSGKYREVEPDETTRDLKSYKSGKYRGSDSDETPRETKIYKSGKYQGLELDETSRESKSYKIGKYQGLDSDEMPRDMKSYKSGKCQGVESDETPRDINIKSCRSVKYQGLESDETPKDAKSYKSGKYQGLEPDEIVFSSEEEKSSTKKPRKPKTKLGVRLSKGKDVSEKEKDSDSCSIEVTLPAPKKSWSSIVSSKSVEQDMSLELSEEEGRPILDLPEIESGDDFTTELPKKSYSTVAKQHLFEIDPNEDVCDSTILLPEKIYKQNTKTRTLDEFNLLKIDTKSSDDEKQENGSSQTETTESDDSSKVIAMDTEEDSCQPEITKSTRQGTEKTVKRKSKKKKR